MLLIDVIIALAMLLRVLRHFLGGEIDKELCENETIKNYKIISQIDKFNNGSNFSLKFLQRELFLLTLKLNIFKYF